MTSVDKRDSYVIVAQPSPQFTARLVDRWQEALTAPRAASSHLVGPVRDGEADGAQARHRQPARQRALGIIATTSIAIT